MSECRIPRRRDKVTISGLVSATKYNGASGTVVKYIVEKDRYQVQLDQDSADGKKKSLEIRRSSLILRESKTSNNEVDGNLQNLSMHVLVPCHINNNRRLGQFFECAKSLCEQKDTNFRVFFGISGTKELREDAIAVLRSLNQGLLQKKNVRADWYTLVEEEQEQKAQFEHMRDMVRLSSSIDSNAWLMFLDNDDMYTPERVAHFKRSALRCNTGEFGRLVDAFWSGGKLLIDASKIGEDRVSLETLLRGDSKMDEYVRVAATMEENSKMDVDEYFDFCTRTLVLEHFIDLTPEGLLKNPFCDVRFMASLSRICGASLRHPEEEWMLMHYRMKHNDRINTFVNRDCDLHSNAMVAIQITKLDRDLSVKTGVEPFLIACCRKDIEEGAISFIARDEQNLEECRKRHVPRMNDEYGQNFGTLLWDETCREFNSFFSKELMERNTAWCMEGPNPYKVFAAEDNLSMDDNHY